MIKLRHIRFDIQQRRPIQNINIFDMDDSISNFFHSHISRDLKKFAIVEYSPEIQIVEGVTEHRLSKSLPEGLKGQLPTIDALEAELAEQ